MVRCTLDKYTVKSKQTRVQQVVSVWKDFLKDASIMHTRPWTLQINKHNNIEECSTIKGRGIWRKEGPPCTTAISNTSRNYWGGTLVLKAGFPLLSSFNNNNNNNNREINPIVLLQSVTYLGHVIMSWHMCLGRVNYAMAYTLRLVTSLPNGLAKFIKTSITEYV